MLECTDRGEYGALVECTDRGYDVLGGKLVQVSLCAPQIRQYWWRQAGKSNRRPPNCSTFLVCRRGINTKHFEIYFLALPICTVATVQLLYAIPILTVTISVHTVTNMYGSHSTVTVCHSNPHCHYISAHCYQYVR